MTCAVFVRPNKDRPKGVRLPTCGAQSGAASAFEEAAGCGFEFGEIFVDSGGEDGVGGVEVAVGEPVPHPDNLPPRKSGLGGEEFVRESPDGFADLDEPYSYGVEDQPVAQVTPLEMGPDGGYCRQDVPEALTISAAHKATASATT